MSSQLELIDYTISIIVFLMDKLFYRVHSFYERDILEKVSIEYIVSSVNTGFSF